MESILLDEKEIQEYLYDRIFNTKCLGHEIDSARYHHNASYKDAVSICKYGILTLKDLNKLGLRNDSDEILSLMDVIESHVNGNDHVSLSVVGLEDLYRDEFEYDPFSPNYVDFLVSSDIRTSKICIHYGNEFLSYGSIDKKYLKSVDVRILKLLSDKKYCDDYFSKVLNNYRYLKEIAMELKRQNLHIPLREMSYDDIFELDLDELISQPDIKIKQKV